MEWTLPVAVYNVMTVTQRHALIQGISPWLDPKHGWPGGETLKALFFTEKDRSRISFITRLARIRMTSRLGFLSPPVSGSYRFKFLRVKTYFRESLINKKTKLSPKIQATELCF